VDVDILLVDALDSERTLICDEVDVVASLGELDAKSSG